MRQPALLHREAVLPELHEEFAIADLHQAGFEQLLVAPDVELRAEVLGVGEADHRVGESATVTASDGFDEMAGLTRLFLLFESGHEFADIVMAQPFIGLVDHVPATRLPHVGQVQHAVIHLDDVAFVGSEFEVLHLGGRRGLRCGQRRLSRKGNPGLPFSSF